jgi:hypothetical protein
MAYYSYLSRWERIKRRFKLLGGSYTHPDGLIELDFEEPAGINPFVDSEEVQQQKLVAYETRKNVKSQKLEYLVVGLVVGYLIGKYHIF